MQLTKMFRYLAMKTCSTKSHASPSEDILLIVLPSTVPNAFTNGQLPFSGFRAVQLRMRASKERRPH